MKGFLKIFSGILTAVLVTSLTGCFGSSSKQSYSKLEELESVIDKYFVEESDQEALENAAAAAMVEALGDRWSYYMTDEEYRAYKERLANAYVGIGISILQREDGFIDIVKVEADGPAAQAGIRAGDVLFAVEGQKISEMTVSEVQDLVRGDAGTCVTLTVTRDGKSLTLEVERKAIQSIVAAGTMLSHKIGLVTIENFDDRCAEETIAAVQKLLEQGAEGLIFDVRFNPGGYKHELVKVLDYLLPEGELFRSVDYKGEESVDMSDANCVTVPMVVMINGDSYSAAEFFAAALNEYGVAKLVGQPTTGKGHFQSAIELSDGSAVVLSIGRYYTPKGVSLADTGLTPDILVEVDDETYRKINAGELQPEADPQIQVALAALLSEE